MRVVVDSGVVAAYVLKADRHYKEVQDFFRCVTEPIAPSSWETELAHVVGHSAMSEWVSPNRGLESLRFAKALRVRSIAVQELWESALTLALAKKCPVHRAVFVQLAMRESLALATFSRQLLDLFPEVAKLPAELTG